MVLLRSHLSWNMQISVKTGLAAITLKDDDQLIEEVKYTEDDEDVFLVTKNGQCIRFHE